MEQISKRLMNWASILEPKTRDQAERAASMPFIYPHLALMPDCHLGKGATVGSVIPTLGAIIPAAVGVDIGCGMMAVRTQFTADDAKHRGGLAALRESIEQAIPLSAGKYNAGIRDTHTEACVAALEERDGADRAEQIAPNWRLQLGSLGSGNHFIEVSLDEDNRVWLFLHSGSRGVGNKLAMRHIKIAQQQCQRRWITLPDPDLAYLVEGEPEFWAYIRDLRWAQQFALLNREEMMHRVRDCVASWIGAEPQALEAVNCHHNYTELMDSNLANYWLPRTGSQGSGGRLPEYLAAEPASTAPDSRADCPTECRSYGELVRLAKDIAREPSPSLVGARARNLLWSLTDALERESSRNPHHPQFGHPCNCQSGHQSDCVADAARTLVNTLKATHPSAARIVSRTWDIQLHAADDPASDRHPRGSESLPPQHSKGGEQHIWLSRKGAIDASAGKPGLIPGSMGTRSYVVEGKGNRLALNSSPHGAGREYSRSAARKKFTRSELDAAMAGIEWRRTDAFLDEIPAAYKDVDVVMADAADLVEVRHTLRQIVNVKGD